MTKYTILAIAIISAIVVPIVGMILYRPKVSTPKITCDSTREQVYGIFGEPYRISSEYNFDYEQDIIVWRYDDYTIYFKDNLVIDWELHYGADESFFFRPGCF